MIRAVFFADSDWRISKIELTGHADYTDEGVDPLCAAVTGMVTLVVNTLTEVMGLPCKVRTPADGHLSLELAEGAGDRGQDILRGLQVQLEDYQAQYPENVQVLVQN